jgi:RNA polymerase sigma factor (TIGR02999 family)
MAGHAPSEVAKSPLAVGGSGKTAIDRAFPLIYNDLRALARRYLSSEPDGHTLQPTALVNEAYLKLADQTRVEWRSRSHFFAVGAMAMRRILVNHAVAASRQKRGGRAMRVELDEAIAAPGLGQDILAIDGALRELASLNERHARVVELRVFGGLTIPEIAEALEVSVSTVEKDWKFSSAWLRNALRS